MADEAQERVGDLIDERYKLVEVMASGSMGAVYKAERVPVGKIVAVKFLHASFANDSEFQARFDRETRVMSKLAHPNCVSVVDFGVWKDEPYLVMDFVAGITLRRREDEGGRIPIAQALQLAKQIAAGLAHAHEQGIVHRDVKPANIMITDEIGHGERVRILDFGLARLRGNVGRDATQTNVVVGTPNYMAPEQTVPGGTIDARTDIYAVGVVLFEMIAGERPFRAEDTMQLLGMHRAAPIPKLADRMPADVDLPDGLQELIDKAMAKSPKDRHQTAIELANALDALAGTSSRVALTPLVVEASPPKKKATGPAAVAPTMLDVDTTNLDAAKPSKLWRYAAALAVLVGGAAAMAGYLMKRDDAKRDVYEHEQAKGSAAAVAIGSAVAGSGSAIAMITPPVFADAPVVEIDAAAETGSGSGSDVGSGSATESATTTGSGSAIASAGSGSAEEIEMDPSTAEDPDPEANTGSATEEAADAPKTKEEIETHVPTPAAPQLATNLHDAVTLIEDGKRDLALASLRNLAGKSPRSAYIPFLLGNLYFDQRWWSVAMDHYADAIKKNAEYRQNPTINRNVIKMLGSPKTQNRATNFLRGTIGHPAVIYLKFAATHEPNAVVRKQAAVLARYIH
ncbi:MAG TPA: protein kinase [Kofleriaceae bacterium]|jgi:serine/threonine-protein kinase|nr:protein kinase [Kofleriaceae bacterium]